MEWHLDSYVLVAKKVFSYVKGTYDQELLFPDNKYCNKKEFIGLLDSSWSKDIEITERTFGFVLKLGDVAFSWSSKKQYIVTLSSCEAEFAAASGGACQAV